MTPMPRSSIIPRATRRWQNVAVVAALAVIAALVVAGRFQGEDDGVSLRAWRASSGRGRRPTHVRDGSRHRDAPHATRGIGQLAARIVDLHLRAACRTQRRHRPTRPLPSGTRKYKVN